MTNTREKIYLSSPHMSGLEQGFISEAFQSNWIAPLGPNVDSFEKELAEYAGTRGAAVFSSGTAAIHLALKLLGVGAGDRVICSSLTFSASANPIVYQGAEPMFIDSEPQSWNMSPVALEKALNAAEKSGRLPKAAVVVDLYGQSADIEPLKELLDKYKVPMIEDAAEALGATYRGKSCGSWGEFGIFSFNGNKIITTSGGGAIVSDNLEALQKARFWATQARDKARHYQHSEIGYNYRLSNILAGIGRGQLQVLEARVKARRAVFDQYNSALGNLDGINFMPEASFGKANRWLTVLTLDPEKTGTSVTEILDALEQENIEARPVWKPLHLQPVFEGCQYYKHGSDLSISDQLFANGICLPSGSNLTCEDVSRVIDVVKSCLR